MVGWLEEVIKDFLFLAMRVAEYFEIKEINTEIINENYNYDQFIADTVEYDFGEFISDIEQGPDGLVYCAIRGQESTIVILQGGAEVL